MRRKRHSPLLSSLWKFNAALTAVYLAVLAAGNGGLASVLDYKDVKADPFDGMAYPIQYVPNWLKSGVWTVKTKYSEIDAKDFVEIPKYDAKLLAVTDPDDEKALFARYTYITPYMGAYLDDARKEYAGSHLAVDVRAALGTPVRSIANGVVVRVKTDAGGDGKYVVIRHDAVPYNGQSLQMYSSYLHVDDLAVKEGQKVRKGDLVAKVGMTGITTTPHLHFQLDRANAPFFPYWPFTFAEAKKAGYDMFSAVNAGLGAQAALAYTYSPFDVIRQNLDYSPSSVPAASVVTATKPATAVAAATTAAKPAVDPALLSAAASAFGSDSSAASSVTTQNSAPAASAVLAAVSETAAVPDVRDVAVDPLPSSATSSSAPAPAQTAAPAASAPAVSGVASAASEIFASAPAVAPVVSLAVAQERAQAGSVTVRVTALDVAGRATSAPVFGGAKVSLTRAGSVVASAALASDAFQGGSAAVTVAFAAAVPDGVRVDGDGMIASASLAGMVAASATAQAAPAQASASAATKAYFSDVPAKSVYFEAVQALAAKGVVKGVSKTKFAPANSITRAEALAVVMRALNVQVDPKARVKMSDVPAGHWVQPYLAKAAELGAVAPGRKSFGPNVAVTRSEIAALMFALGRVPTTELDVVDVTDVPASAWYAKYAKTAVQFGVMKAFSGKFRPTARITRGDVAVAVFNFLKKFPAQAVSA